MGRTILLALAALATPALAAMPPAGMMANVYRLTEAAAVVTVCTRSDAFKALPAQKARQLDDLLSRLGAVVGAIGRHYRDDTLAETFEATREKIAGETAMRGYVKTKYQYCADALVQDMSAYVESNEKLLHGYFERESERSSRESAAKPPR